MKRKALMKVISLVLVLVMIFPASFAITAFATVGGEPAEDEFHYLSIEELQQLSQEEIANYCREFCRHEFQDDSLAFSDSYGGGIQPYWSSDPSKTGDFSTYKATHAFITAYGILSAVLIYQTYFPTLNLSGDELNILYYCSEAPDYMSFRDKGMLGSGKAFHFYNPTKNIDLGTAKYAYRHYLNLAISEAKSGNRISSIQNLGYALHFIQDVCEPHHARGTPLFNHGPFETWVANNFENIDSSDEIDISSETFNRLENKSPNDIIHSGALISYNYFDLAKNKNTFPQAAKKSLGNAIVYTILTFRYFKIKANV